jgi:tetratricopeptide (TPR) repeat protein
VKCRAKIYQERGQIEKALEDYELIIDHYPDDPWIYFLKGDLLKVNNRYEEAINYFSRVLQFEPEFDVAYPAYVFRAMCFSALNKHDKADADYEKAAQLEKTHEKP